MSRKVGIIGMTGRMGHALMDIISKRQDFIAGVGFSRSQTPHISLEDIFAQNDYIFDFSTPELVEEILKAAVIEPKPLVLCTTGWSEQEMHHLIEQVAKKVPIVIASNTSVGAYLQRYVIRQLARALGDEYDIDIIEKHHRNKIDSPSGTALSLFNDIKMVKMQLNKSSYQTHKLEKGPRPDHSIGMAVTRSGNLPGDHEVSFVSADEMISVKHVAFDRTLFAKGAIRIIEWLDKTKPKPGLYTMGDVLSLE